MKFTFEEKEIYSLSRELLHIRSSLQLLESEMMYLPLKTSEAYQNQFSKYQVKLETCREHCSKAMTIVNGSYPDHNLFG